MITFLENFRTVWKAVAADESSLQMGLASREPDELKKPPIEQFKFSTKKDL